MLSLRFFMAIIIGIMPFNKLRILFYKLLMGYEVDKKSKIGPFNLLFSRAMVLKSASIESLNIIGIDTLSMEADSSIGKLNTFRKLRMIHLSKGARIRHRNFIGGTYGTIEECGREILTLGENSQISISCFLDLTDEIQLGSNVVVAGSGTQFWTHGYNHLRVKNVAPILVQNNVFIGAASTIVQGVTICSNVTIGAGTVVHRSIYESGLYVSNELRKV